MIALICLSLWIVIGAVIVRQPKFGSLPRGDRMRRIQESPNYRNGAFQNLIHTPMIAGAGGYVRAGKAFIFGRSKRSVPSVPIPGVKIDLHSLDRHEDVLIWFGHSSYFLQTDGIRFLIDPVLSGHASPFTFTTPSNPGTDRYRPEDIPAIDYLLLTHDHWDHLDHDAVTALRPKIGTVITGLGTGAHLERWGFEQSKIIEKDWHDTVTLDADMTITLTPARHFSGRLFKRNQVLWTSFVLKTRTKKIFIGGDSGYGPHFAAIGEQYGPFDLAILECGQYNELWHSIHMMPEETVQAAIDLRSRALLPVHWGKFVLSIHSWDEPIIRATAEADRKHVPILHPMIGEKMMLNTGSQTFPKWWEAIQNER